MGGKCSCITDTEFYTSTDNHQLLARRWPHEAHASARRRSGQRRQIGDFKASGRIQFRQRRGNRRVDALRFVSDFAIDLIVTEVRLPKLDAVQLLQIVRNGAFGPKPPPTIICSARLHEASWVTHPALQGLTLLAKPLTPQAFATALDAAFPVEHLD